MSTRAIAAVLNTYIAASAAVPFSWTRHNCCHFVAGWICCATDQPSPMRGLPYTHGRRAAWRLIRQLGGSLAGAWTQRLGRSPIQPELARTGDIVLVHLGLDDSAAVGICNGRHVALLTEADGVTMLPMTHARLAWRLHDDSDNAAREAGA